MTYAARDLIGLRDAIISADDIWLADDFRSLVEQL